MKANKILYGKLFNSILKYYKKDNMRHRETVALVYEKFYMDSEDFPIEIEKEFERIINKNNIKYKEDFLPLSMKVLNFGFEKYIKKTIFYSEKYQLSDLYFERSRNNMNVFITNLNLRHKEFIIGFSKFKEFKEESFVSYYTNELIKDILTEQGLICKEKTCIKKIDQINDILKNNLPLVYKKIKESFEYSFCRLYLTTDVKYNKNKTYFDMRMNKELLLNLKPELSFKMLLNIKPLSYNRMSLYFRINKNKFNNVDFKIFKNYNKRRLKEDFFKELLKYNTFSKDQISNFKKSIDSIFFEDNKNPEYLKIQNLLMNIYIEKERKILTAENNQEHRLKNKRRM